MARYCINVRKIGRLGHRGRALLALAFLFVSYGIGLALVALGIDGPAVPTLRVVGQAVPSIVLAAVWLIGAPVCGFHAFRSRDAIGWATASSILVGWTLLSVAAWLFDHAPRGYVAVAIWGTFAALVVILSGWPEAYPQRQSKSGPETFLEK